MFQRNFRGLKVAFINAEWQSDSTSTPGNISCGQSLCYFTLAAKSETINRYAPLKPAVSMAQGSSWDAIIDKWTEKYGLAGSFSLDVGWLGNDLIVCPVLGAVPALIDSSGVIVAPGGSCNIIPPAPAKCDFMVRCDPFLREFRAAGDRRCYFEHYCDS